MAVGGGGARGPPGERGWVWDGQGVSMGGARGVALPRSVPLPPLYMAPRQAFWALLSPWRMRPPYCSGSCPRAPARARPERGAGAPWCTGGRLAGRLEAGSDPGSHLGVTWGVYLCADKPPLADIILSHPPDLTRCNSVIGLAILAMSGHIQYRGAASGDLYIGISGINRVLLS